MKNIVLSVLYLVLVTLCHLSPVYATTLPYALVGNDCILYLDEQTLSPLFCLPSSYFVKVLNEEDNVWKVSYLDVVGFVKSETVEKVDYVPLYKYPKNTDCSLLNDGNTITLRSSPFHQKDNVITKLTHGSTATFYGVRVGSDQIPALGNEWCYIRDMDGNYGYVYSLYVQIPTFSPNDFLAKQELQSAQVGASTTLNLPFSAIIITVLCVCVTALLIVALKTTKRRE